MLLLYFIFGLICFLSFFALCLYASRLTNADHPHYQLLVGNWELNIDDFEKFSLMMVVGIFISCFWPAFLLSISGYALLRYAYKIFCKLIEADIK